MNQLSDMAKYQAEHYSGRKRNIRNAEELVTKFSTRKIFWELSTRVIHADATEHTQNARISKSECYYTSRYKF